MKKDSKLPSKNIELNGNTQQTHLDLQSNLIKIYTQRWFEGIGNNGLSSFITLIGDSYLEGRGATSESKQYGSIIRDTIFSKNNMGMPKTYEQTLKMDRTGFSYAGTYSFGSAGSAKKSLILQPNATVTFTRRCNYTDIWYHRTTTSGSVEIRLNNNVVKTINCNGTENLNAWSGWSNINSNPQDSDVWQLKCIDAQVEITGITNVIWTPNGLDSMYFTRIGVSGVSSSYYADNDTITSIKLQGTYNNTNKGIFVLEIGTNDIYNPDSATTSEQYKENITNILSSFKNDGHLPVLVIPTKANSTWKEVKEPYSNYVNVALDVANSLGIPFIDLSKVDFSGLNLFSNDGIHPNDNGHYLISKYILDVLGITHKNIVDETPISPTLRNGWTNFGNGAMPVGYWKDSKGYIHMRGLVKGGTVNSSIFELPIGYRPIANEYYLTLSDGQIGGILITSGGNVQQTLGSNVNISLSIPPFRVGI